MGKVEVVVLEGLDLWFIRKAVVEHRAELLKEWEQKLCREM